MADELAQQAERVLARTAASVNRKLERLAKPVTNGIVMGMNEISSDLLQRGTDLAPILHGDLIQSARVARKTTKRVIKRTVMFGTDHAVWTHEANYNLGPISRRKPATEDGPVGRKYLERPFRRHRARYSAHVLKRGKDELR